MSRQLPSGTVTLVFTDVEGSTRLLHDLGAESYAEALAEHRRLVRTAFVDLGGVEVDTQGDAFFYAFADAGSAVAAAAAANDAVFAGPIRIRIGLHTGTPHLTKEGYVGEDVHLGARIAAAGHGGQVLLSAATQAHLDGGVTDLGEHRLKDFAEPVGIFQLGEERFPPLKTISNTNLPRPASSFIGRERETADVAELVRQHRFVTMSGPGGSGKTRLSIEAAADLVGEFKAGVFWIGLAAIRDPALVAETIGQTLGAKDSLADHIGARELLLLLDNLEQVVDAAPELAALVEACPRLHLLVTSREILRVRGEVEYAVEPLAQADAVTLFCERARLEPDETIAELCRRLDNLPLAVELAAARTSVLTPAQILDRLAERLDLLKGGRDADLRQQTLRATIEWSHDLLTGPEKQLFARLGVFRGGCTLATAETIVDADLDELQSLVDKSLLRHTGDRFWMLETIREYAVDQLDQPDVAQRHASHYLALGEEAYRHISVDQELWVGQLDAEHDNLRAALDHFEAQGDSQQGLQLAGALHRYWYTRGHLREGRERVERLLVADKHPTQARARALDAAAVLALNQADYAAARQRAEAALALHRELGDLWGVAYAEMLLGALASGENDFETARRLSAEAEARFRELGDEYYARLSAANRGYYLQELGRLDEARDLLEGVLQGARAAGEERNEGAALGQLGQVAIMQDRYLTALQLLVESLRIWNRIGDVTMAARDLRRLSRALGELGHPEPAAQVLSVSERMREEAGQWEGWIGGVNETILALVHAQLDKDAFENAWARGKELTVDEAIELAVESAPPGR
jgi:predicted ATPase